MKSFLFFLCSLFLLSACSSSETKEACVKIYQEGTTKIRNAQTPQEISDIAYEVAQQLSEMGNSPQGDVKLSATDQMELFQKQQEFYQAIENRARQLTPQNQIQQNTAPIMRTTVSGE